MALSSLIQFGPALRQKVLVRMCPRHGCGDLVGTRGAFEHNQVRYADQDLKIRPHNMEVWRPVIVSVDTQFRSSKALNGRHAASSLFPGTLSGAHRCYHSAMIALFIGNVKLTNSPFAQSISNIPNFKLSVERSTQPLPLQDFLLQP